MTRSPTPSAAVVRGSPLRVRDLGPLDRRGKPGPVHASTPLDLHEVEAVRKATR
jgi:hypothetical protein